MQSKPTPITYFILGLVAAYFGFKYLSPNAGTPTTEASTTNTETNALAGQPSNPQTVGGVNECLSRCATSGIPTAVCMTVTAMFPDVNCEQVDLEKKAYGYEAIFSVASQTIEMEFNNSGSLIETEYENYPKSKVPAAVIAAFERDFAGRVVKEYEMERSLSGETSYELEILDSKDTDITYDSEGRRISNTNED